MGKNRKNGKSKIPKQTSKVISLPPVPEGTRRMFLDLPPDVYTVMRLVAQEIKAGSPVDVLMSGLETLKQIVIAHRQNGDEVIQVLWNEGRPKVSAVVLATSRRKFEVVPG